MSDTRQCYAYIPIRMSDGDGDAPGTDIIRSGVMARKFMLLPDRAEPGRSTAYERGKL